MEKLGHREMARRRRLKEIERLEVIFAPPARHKYVPFIINNMFFNAITESQYWALHALRESAGTNMAFRCAMVMSKRNMAYEDRNIYA